MATSEEREKDLKNKITELENVRNELEAKTHQGRQEIEGGVANVQQLQTTISALNDQLKDSQNRQNQMEQELSGQANQFNEFQQRYEKELISHAQTASTLNDLRETIKSNDTLITELEQAKKLAEGTLQDSVNDAKTTETTLRSQYASLKEQFETVEKENAILHDQLSNVTTQMTSLQDKTVDKDSSSLNLSKSFSEDEAKSMDQLMEIIKYLRQEKAILTGKVDVSQAESIRMKAQFESIQHQLNETQNALSNAQKKANQELLPSSKYSLLLEKVQTIPALSDSNRILREERDRLKVQLSDLDSKLKHKEDFYVTMEKEFKDLKEQNDKTQVELSAVKADNLRWRSRVDQLIEKHQKVSPEEMMKVQNENTGLKKKVMELTNEHKTLNSKLSELTNKIKLVETQIKNKDQIVANLNKEMINTKTTNQTIGQKFNQANKKATELEAEKVKLIAEKETLQQESQTKIKQAQDASIASASQLKELVDKFDKKDNELKAKNETINRLKQLGRTLKEQKESNEQQLSEKSAEIETLKQELSKAQEVKPTSSENVTEQGSSASDDTKADEAEALIKQSMEKISELEQSNEKLKVENEGLNKEKDRARTLLMTAKKKIGELTNENKSLKSGKEPSTSVDEKMKETLEEKIKNLETSLATSKTEFEESQTLLANCKTELEETKQEREKIQIDREKLQGERW